MENKYWKKCVGSLIGAIWLYTLADIAGSVTEFVNGMLSPGGMMGMLSAMMGEGGSSFGLGDLLEYVFPLLALLGYWMFYSSLTDFMRWQRSDADRAAVGKVRKSYILMVIAILVGYLWIPGRIASLILVIIAYCKLLSGYRNLKRSATFPEQARRGAGLLFASTVWLLVGSVIGMIPIVGDAIESVIGLVVFFCVLGGWGRIRRGAPELSEAEATELEQAENTKIVHKSVIPRGWFPAYVGISLIASFIFFALQMEWLPEHVWEFNPDSFRTTTFRLVSMIIDITAQLLMVGFCCYLLADPKTLLSRLSRVGLILMITMTVLSLLVNYLFFILPKPQGIETYKFYIYREWLLLAIYFATVVAMMLFVWSTRISLTVKITLTVYEVLGYVGGYVLLPLCQMWAEARFDGDPDAEGNFVWLIYRLYYLAINVLAFVVVLIPLLRDRQKPAAELPVA